MALLLAGCGESRTPVPNVNVPAAPRSYIRLSFPRIGVSFYAPKNWTRVNGRGFAVIASASAVISLRAYSSNGSTPATAAALAAARGRLIAAAHNQDRTLQLIRTKLTRVDGVDAIVLDAMETIAGARRRVRSLHLFPAGGEIVIEESAPLALFHIADHYVFSPLNHSLRLLAPRA
ncbi:MAG TPA: hypothetical protein VG410_03225 [Solirubrobacteraceae bacterium]|nr:hypothetical protein [Solirubrobacteraceae bacterium]